MNKTLVKQREELYKFLSALYLWEVNEKQFNEMQKLAIPSESGIASWDTGWREFADFFKTNDKSCLESLAVDYAYTFLAAGVAQGHTAFPYESVYTDKYRQLGGEADSAVSAIYAKKGLKPNDENFYVPSDHFGLELAFMAHICSSPKAEQKAFFEKHIKGWSSEFCRDVEKYAKTGFYKAVAKITIGFIELESELMLEEDELWNAK